MTGLHNRRFVDQFIESEIAAVKRRHVEAGDPMPDGSARDSSRLLFLLMIDLDGFKAINDTFGHHAGDEALREVRNRLIGGCRRSDVVVRWGGDEFLVVGHASSFDGVKALAEKIRLTVAEPAYEVGNGRTGQLSASIGIAAIPFVEARPDLGTWEQIVAVADHGAYLAKLNGRNAWVSIRGTDRTRHDDFVGMKENLSNLVHDGKLMIDSSTDEPIAFSFDETLVRMQVG